MRSGLSAEEVADYRTNGFLAIADLLSESELETWRDVVDAALQDDLARQPDGSNPLVYTQRMNLRLDSETVKELVARPCIGRLVAELEGIEAARIYLDQLLVKEPYYASPTSYRLDLPWSPFESDHACTITARSGWPSTMRRWRTAACTSCQAVTGSGSNRRGLHALQATLSLTSDAIAASGAATLRITGGMHLAVAFAMGAALPTTRFGRVEIVDLTGATWTSQDTVNGPLHELVTVDVDGEFGERLDGWSRIALFVTITEHADTS